MAAILKIVNFHNGSLDCHNEFYCTGPNAALSILLNKTAIITKQQ